MDTADQFLLTLFGNPPCCVPQRLTALLQHAAAFVILSSESPVNDLSGVIAPPLNAPSSLSPAARRLFNERVVLSPGVESKGCGRVDFSLPLNEALSLFAGITAGTSRLELHPMVRARRFIAGGCVDNSLLSSTVVLTSERYAGNAYHRFTSSPPELILSLFGLFPSVRVDVDYPVSLAYWVMHQDVSRPISDAQKLVALIDRAEVICPTCWWARSRNEASLPRSVSWVPPYPVLDRTHLVLFVGRWYLRNYAGSRMAPVRDHVLSIAWRYFFNVLTTKEQARALLEIIDDGQPPVTNMGELDFFIWDAMPVRDDHLIDNLISVIRTFGVKRTPVKRMLARINAHRDPVCVRLLDVVIGGQNGVRDLILQYARYNEFWW